MSERNKFEDILFEFTVNDLLDRIENSINTLVLLKKYSYEHSFESNKKKVGEMIEKLRSLYGNLNVE